MVSKIFIQKSLFTVLLMFLILTLATIPIINNNRVLRTNLEIRDNEYTPTNYVYLINQDHYFVKVGIHINQKKKAKLIPNIITYLKIDNQNIPNNLNGYIPKKAKLLNYKLEDDTISLNFSKEIMTSSKEKNKQIVAGIVYSLLEIKSIKNIEIMVEDKPIDNYPKKLNHRIGINQIYNLKKRNNIQRVTIYYLDKYNTYYLPITKYINSKKSKIEIIMEELKNPEEKNVISPLNNNINLINYREEENVLYLNFDKKIEEINRQEKEKVMNTILYSCFANYDVNIIMIEIENQTLDYYKRGES